MVYKVQLEFNFGQKRIVHPVDCDGQHEECDVHTEHCCSQHKRCKYGGYEEIDDEKACTVIASRGKIITKCNCEWM